MWLALTMTLALTIACKPQGTQSEGKFSSKLARKATKGADELTAVKKLVNKGNKTDDEWGELAEAVVKGGAKADAIIKGFASRINKNKLTIDALANQVGKIDSDTALVGVRKKLANEFNELADNLTDNIRLMEHAFVSSSLSFAKRADIFAKLHPGGDSYQIALRAFNGMHDTGIPFKELLRINSGYATRAGVTPDAYRFISGFPEVGLAGKTLAERQIKALFNPLEDTSSLSKTRKIIDEMQSLQYTKGQEELQKVTAKTETALINNYFSGNIKSLGGRKSLQECCGQHLVDTLKGEALRLSRTLRRTYQSPNVTPSFSQMVEDIADELENLHYILD